MFNLSGSEIVIILLLALVVLGPEKLPDAIRRFGKLYGELKRMSSSFQDEMRSTLDEPMREMRETADLLREQATFDPDEVASNSKPTQHTTQDGDDDGEPVDRDDDEPVDSHDDESVDSHDDESADASGDGDATDVGAGDHRDETGGGTTT